MRIDGLSSPSVSPDRSSRAGSAVTPYREVMRDAEVRREQPSATSASQGLESQAQTRRVEASNASSNASLPIVFNDSLSYQRPLSSRAAQALASYSSTANLPLSANDAPEVLGIDLYA
ncbi:hypothetical protein [Pseudomonas panipatensis]|uniref:Uncharacterized protein n=1 Tax=Pseudomonas panipatensis TaxID=428992 RepID=A0A1G8DNG7_9PSED|nr:hypothetical protein [Pseudomonas panipatensis]SDH59145.1 hypothetical protein SAMN05216272_10261 [Pseudomonas panipatensis]SMP40660.1 hypothetical protein SAMN06295951_101430 [Pseudomonas panipatensis]